MTDTDRPDVAALAAQLHMQFGCRITCRGGRLADDGHPSHAEAWANTAEAIIAALAAQGWRITSAPEASSIPEVAGDGVGTADDPVSAQAAPDWYVWPERSLQVEPEPDPMTAPPRLPPARRNRSREQAAVRAALGGLRAEVAVLPEASFGAIWRGAVLDRVDARLAALDD